MTRFERWLWPTAAVVTTGVALLNVYLLFAVGDSGIDAIIRLSFILATLAYTACVIVWWRLRAEGMSASGCWHAGER